jgi:hypothetical protein
LLKQQSSIAVYRLPTSRKQTLVFRFRLQQTNGTLLFPFSITSKQTEVAVFHIYNTVYISSENGNPGDFP